MRVEYALWHCPPGRNQYIKDGQFDSQQAAYDYTHITEASDWELTPSGAMAVRPDARENLPFYDWIVTAVRVPETDTERVQLAAELLLEYGQEDGDHHKTWVIDQVLRILTGERYQQVISEYCAGEDGPETYPWEEGIAP